jgi:eukaryotic-like serine/threonine-protein kinase
MTGAKPISGDSVERIFYSILNEPLKMEPMVQAGAPEAVCQLVTHCTAKSPAERPQGFGPVIAELERIIAELDAPTQIYKAPDQEPVVIQEVVRHPKWLIPVIAAVVVLLAAGLYFAMKPKKLAETITAKSGEMVLVPAGHFLFGKEKTDAQTGAYYIDKTEVTNQAYADFCKATGRPLPRDFPSDKAKYPVVNVTIDDAESFAKWAGERLPSAREWEKAARGTDGRAYPWGNAADPSKANIGSSSLSPAIDFAAAASPYKTLQMIGNAWELIEEPTTPSDRQIKEFAKMQPPPTLNDIWHQARGGSYQYPQLVPDLTFDSTPIPAGWKAPDIGFRCVKDAQ